MQCVGVKATLSQGHMYIGMCLRESLCLYEPHIQNEICTWKYLLLLLIPLFIKHLHSYYRIKDVLEMNVILTDIYLAINKITNCYLFVYCLINILLILLEMLLNE